MCYIITSTQVTDFPQNLTKSFLGTTRERKASPSQPFPTGSPTVPAYRVPPPWKGNPKLAARNARLHRLKRKGFLPSLTKAEARRMCNEAIAAKNPKI